MAPLTGPLCFSVPHLAHCFEQPSTVMVGWVRAKFRSPSLPAKNNGRQSVTVTSGRSSSNTRRVARRAIVPSGIASPLHEMMPTL